MKKTLLSAASSIGIVTAALLFTGCGDSDSSSSTSSTAGTQTGQFVKGPWKGISYTRSNGVNGVTGVNGTFTYNPGENVTFNFGLGTARWESGSTGNSTSYVTVPITSCINPQTGASALWTIVDAAKVATAFSAYGVNETGMGTTDLSTLIASLSSKVPTINVSSLTASTLSAALAAVGTTISGAPTSFNATAVTDAAVNNKVTEVTNAAVAAATANLPVGYNLNDTNKKIVLSNGTATSFTKVNNTAINISGTTYSVLGALTGGVSLVSPATNTSLTAKVVALDLVGASVNPNGKSLSLSINGVNKTYTFNGTTSGTYTLNVSGSTLANGGGNWSATSDGLGIALIPSNATVGGANATVTFEDDFTASNGAVAKLWSGAISSITSAYNTITEVVYSTATTVLKHLH